MTTKKYILTADDVEDNLTSHLQDVPLSANMGRELKALIDSGGGGAIVIAASATEGGSITPIGEVGVLKGEDKTFTIAPNTGYRLSNVKVDGASVGTPTTYTFSRVQAGHQIEAVFSIITFNVSMSAGAHGTITGDAVVNYGSTHTYTITPNAGCRIVDVVLDGVSKGAVPSVVISNIMENHTLTATFAQTYTITASAGANGSISPSGAVVKDVGSSQTFTFTPASGYVVEKFIVDGVVQTAATSYTFNDIQSAHTISVSFMENPQNFYTFTINKNTAASSPTTCVTYSEGVSNASQAYAVAQRWIVPSVVKNGAVNYFLYRGNLQRKATDETGDTDSGVASVLTGSDGDVCLSIRPLWWKVLESNSTTLKIRISDGAFDGAISAHKFNGTIRKWLHVGMFHSTAQACTSIYSTSANPAANIKHDDFRTSTEARGETYNIMTYLTWTLLDHIWTFASGSANSQATIGQDLTSGSKSAVSTAAMLTANGYTSSTKDSASTSLMYLFMANPWGNVRDWVAGLKVDGSNTAVITDQKDARGVSVDAAIPSSWTKFTSPNVSDYIKNVLGNNVAPYFPSGGGGSSSTYFCDYGYSSNSSGKRCGHVGGCYNDGGDAGAFYAAVYSSSSGATANIGARLQVLDINNA